MSHGLFKKGAGGVLVAPVRTIVSDVTIGNLKTQALVYPALYQKIAKNSHYIS